MSKKELLVVERYLLNCMKDPISSFIDSFWRDVDAENKNGVLGSLYNRVLRETDYDEDGEDDDSPDDAIIRLFEKTYKKLVGDNRALKLYKVERVQVVENEYRDAVIVANNEVDAGALWDRYTNYDDKELFPIRILYIGEFIPNDSTKNKGYVISASLEPKFEEV